MTSPSNHRGFTGAHGLELRVGSVVRLSGTEMEMVIKSFDGGFARCVWLDIQHRGNEYPFQTQILERVTW